MRLFHFSEDGDIRQFQPRPVLKAAPRRQGQEWLNGPLVWAIAQTHQRLYLFPRECPRIVIWPHEHSTSEDRAQWLNDLPAAAQAVAMWRPPGPRACMQPGYTGMSFQSSRSKAWRMPACT